MPLLVPENTELEFFLDAELGNVSVDSTRLEQIVVNLIVNARDAMSSGGKTIVETTNTSLDVAYAERNPGVEAGDYVQLTFIDQFF